MRLSAQPWEPLLRRIIADPSELASAEREGVGFLLLSGAVHWPATECCLGVLGGVGLIPVEAMPWDLLETSASCGPRRFVVRGWLCLESSVSACVVSLSQKDTTIRFRAHPDNLSLTGPSAKVCSEAT